MSDCFVMTTSWPIDATGSLPVCFKVILKLVQDAGTVIDPTLYCIASLASISVPQLVTVAAGLSLAAIAPDVVAGVAAELAAAAAVAGPAIGAVDADDGAVPAGAGSFGAWDWVLFPHAESTSVQATTSAGIFRFIIRSPCRNGGLWKCKAPHDVKARAGRHAPVPAAGCRASRVDIKSTRAWLGCEASCNAAGIRCVEPR